MSKDRSTKRLSTNYVKIIFGLLLITLSLTFGAARIFSATPNLVINEILVSNVSLERDPKYNNFSGWIEIYNAGSTSINITGYTLTNDLSNPTLWSIPNQSISPGGHLIFWTDEENKTNHTNFKLNHRGEEVGLFTPTGELVDSLTFGEQIRNVSYGRQSDGSPTWVYFQIPTRAGANNTPGLPDTDQAGEPQFSPVGGFFSSGFTLNISPPSPSTQVTYTLDGTEPTENSTPATSGIPINATTVVRARAFENGVLNGPVITQSYFVNEGTTLPVVSLVTDPDNLFGDTNGIYVIGTNGIDGPCVDYKANYFQAWERPVSVEFFEENGDLGFNFDGGVEIQGGCSRNQPIKGLDIKLSYRYGINKFTYDLFPDYDQKLFKAFLLRPSSQDQSATMFKDGMVQTLVNHRMDVDGQAYRAAALFINGQYWGINNIREKLNDDYVETYHNETDIDLLKPQFNIMDIKNGDRVAYDALSDYIGSHDLSNAANYAYVADRIDINEYINYQIAQIYSGTHDWPHNNIRLWRPREELGKWRWMRYDLDSSFKDPARDSIVWATDPNATYAWSTLYLRKLLENEGFRNEFIQRFAGHMNTTYEASRVVAIIDSMQQNIAGEMPRHRQRWGVPTAATWLEEVAILRDFARRRQAYMTEDLLAFFNIPGMQNLTVNVTGGGKVLVSEVEVPTPSYSGPYFKGIPIRLTAVPDPGYQFTEWQELGLSDSETSITLNADFTITAVFEPSGPPPDLVINEIHYNPSDAQGLDDDYEFFELVNNGSNSVDLEGFTISSGVDFIFPAATSIAPGEYILLAKNAATYSGLSCQVFQWVDSSLSNSGELLQIDDQNGNVIDAVSYDDEGDWPLEPDGAGPSLELTALSFDNALPASWHVSTYSGGSPCALNSDGGPPVTPSPTPDTTIGLLITEIMYNPPDGGEYEFLELKNVSGAPFDLGDSAFVEGITYIFAPGTTLNNNEFLVLAVDPAAFQTKYGFAPFNTVPFDGALSNGGELLSLVNGSGIPIFRVAYDDEGGWPTAPDGGGPSLVPVDPNANLDPHNFINWRASTNAGGSPGADDPPPPPPTDTPTPTETPIPSATPTATNTPTPTFTPTPGPISQGVLVNPGFEDGKNPWKFYSGGGGSFTVASPAFAGTNAAKLIITAPSDNIQLYQFDLSLKPNTAYKLSFAAKSTFGSDVKVSLHKHVANYTNYGINGVTFNLTANWQTFSHEFTTINFTQPVNDARLRLWMNNLAAAGEEYWFDSIILEEVGAILPTATPTTTPTPTATSVSLPAGIVINEIHYHPSDALVNPDDYEFLELVNPGSSPLDLSGYTFSSGIVFTFPAATSIAAGEYILMAKNAATYSGLSCQIFQWTSGSLSNGGELLQLDDAAAVVADAVSYDDEGDWPVLPDGSGPSLEMVDLALDNALAASWQPSTDSGGSPCALNSDGMPPIIQDIPLNQGWNMISSYITLSVPALETALAGIESNMVLIKNDSGQVYWPSMLINSIGDWDVHDGYLISMANADTLTLTGPQVDPAVTAISLSAGWNTVSYLLDTGLPIDQALSSISGELIMVKNGSGELYWPEFGINQIGSMQPGAGYQVYTSAPATLLYSGN